MIIAYTIRIVSDILESNGSSSMAQLVHTRYDGLRFENEEARFRNCNGIDYQSRKSLLCYLDILGDEDH